MHVPYVVRMGQEGRLCDPGSELLLLGGSARVSQCEDNKWDEEKSHTHLDNVIIMVGGGCITHVRVTLLWWW